MTSQKAWEWCSTHLYKAFEGLDASLVELNPLVVTERGVLTLDAKVTVDDSSLYRHEDIAGLHDVEAADPRRNGRRRSGCSTSSSMATSASSATGRGS